MAILSKLADNEAIIVDSINIADAKTKTFQKLLANLKLRGNKQNVGERQYDRRIDGLTCLVGLPKADDNTWLSARNIPGVAVLPVNEFNALTVMRQKRLVLTREALEALRAAKAQA
jgi:large subunit ribosomal protein L4